jgi:NADPH:quinone reductase-like Zn-dependent oxidoreductase
MVPGADLAGIVEEGGPGVVRFGPGDQVFGHLVIAPSLRFLGSYGFGFLIGLAVGFAAAGVHQIVAIRRAHWRSKCSAPSP